MSGVEEAELSPEFCAWVRRIGGIATCGNRTVTALVGATMVESWLLMTRHPEYAAALLAGVPEVVRARAARAVDEGVALYPIERTDG